MKYAQCKKCGWVYFTVSRKYAEAESRMFNEYFDKLTTEEQEDFYKGKKSSIVSYKTCGCGNDYKNFQDEITHNIDGQTINPIMDRNE